MINIKNANKAEVLAALYNGAKPLGMGWLDARSEVMTKEMAEEEIASYGSLYFDYLHGRPLKVDLRKDELNPWAYDRDQGAGKAESVLRNVKGVEIS